MQRRQHSHSHSPPTRRGRRERMQMKRLAFSVWLVVFSAFSVAAQPLAIHAHPQKATYESPAEWPFLSDQCHWMVDGVLAHTHVEMSVPIYAELTPGRITMPITFKLFHTSGRIVGIFSELGIVVLDSIGHWVENVSL